MVYIYLVSHMQSLLLCAESIGGIERSSCFNESFTKSVMIFVVVNDTSICNCGWRWWSTWIACELICDILWDMWRLWYICDVCDIYVVLVIYMCCWWYICDVGDVCYIYLLFVWMGCKKQIKRLFSVTLPSAMAMTLGKVTTWEHVLPSAKAIALGKHHRFAECHGPRTR